MYRHIIECIEYKYTSDNYRQIRRVNITFGYCFFYTIHLHKIKAEKGVKLYVKMWNSVGRNLIEQKICTEEELNKCSKKRAIAIFLEHMNPFEKPEGRKNVTFRIQEAIRKKISGFNQFV